MKPTILVFSGFTGSGKTTISSGIATMLDWKRTSFGDYVRKIAKARGIPLDRQHLQNLGELLILEQGWITFCKSVLDLVKWNHDESLIIDGIRHVEAITTLQKISKPIKFHHVHIKIDPKIRKKRLDSRKITSEFSKEEDKHSTESQLDSLVSHADLIVDGSEPIEEIINKIILWMKDKQ